MRKILLGIAALAAVAITTPASARPFHHGGFHGFHGGFHGGFGPRFGVVVGAPFYAYAGCPIVRVVRYGPWGPRVRYVRSCYY